MNGLTSAADLLRQLDDIKGLHPVSLWPLAIGWWILLALAIMSIGGSLWFYLRRRAWRRSWLGHADQTLLELEARLTADNAQRTAAMLSVMLRRIAMRKFSRHACAGLEGQDWLSWLKEHDPHRFDWPGTARVLIEAPYAPPTVSLAPETVRPLIRAVRKWVR